MGTGAPGHQARQRARPALRWPGALGHSSCRVGAQASECRVSQNHSSTPRLEALCGTYEMLVEWQEGAA